MFLKADHDKAKIHIAISRTPLKKKISRRHDKNINRTDKMDTKEEKPAYLIQHETEQQRADKTNQITR